MANPNGNGRLDRIEGALEALTDRVNGLSATAATLLTGMQSVNASIASLTEVTRLIAGQLNRLAEAQLETEGNLAQAGERIAELATAQQHTDERLNALIATVDDLIRRTSPPPSS